MIDIKTKYQGSIFVNAKDLSPTPKNITTLVNAFGDKEFIPNTFHEISKDNPQPRACIRLSSTNNEWNIYFGMSRIDITKHSIDTKGNNLGTLEEFSTDTIDFFKRIDNDYKKKANRIALIANYMFKEMTDDEFSKVYSKLFQSVPFYKDTEPFEWYWKSASKAQLETSNIKEDLNVVTTINRARGEMTILNEIKPFDRALIAIDINTNPKNEEYRYEFAHVESFFENTIKMHCEILNDIGGYICE